MGFKQIYLKNFWTSHSSVNNKQTLRTSSSMNGNSGYQNMCNIPNTVALTILYSQMLAQENFKTLKLVS